MTKTTIELNRDHGHIKGYGRWGQTFSRDNRATLDALLEWCQANPSAKVYRHLLRQVEENERPDDLYQPFENDPEGRRLCPANPIPKCDLVDYLDIYWQ